jgi:hypothetical protein
MKARHTRLSVLEANLAKENFPKSEKAKNTENPARKVVG